MDHFIRPGPWLYDCGVLAGSFPSDENSSFYIFMKEHILRGDETVVSRQDVFCQARQLFSLRSANGQRDPLYAFRQSERKLATVQIHNDDEGSSEVISIKVERLLYALVMSL